MKEVFMFIAVLIPVVSGFLIPFIHFPGRRSKQIYTEFFVILTSLLVYLLIFNTPEGTFTFARFTRELSLSLRIDGMSVIFGGLIALLWPLATLYAFEYMTKEENENIFFMFYTMTYGVTLGIAFAKDLLTMYFFYELLTLVTVPLVMHTLTREAILAGRKYLYYSLGGAAFAFIGLVFVITNGTTLNFTYGGVLDKAAVAGKEDLFLLIYVMTFLGFGVKAAICPFNSWLPAASVAPTPVTALLHAVAVVKAGAFAILRITYFSYGTALLNKSWAQHFVITVSLITILYGSIKALKETHFKRRLAYSTISNLSYILFSAALLSPLGLVGALSHLVIHAIMKICSFFCAGAVIHQTGINYIQDLDGLGKKMPGIFSIFTIASLALMGVPGLPGFISKWYIAKAAVNSLDGFAYAGIAVLLISALLTAAYMLSIVIRAFFSEKEFKYPESEASDGRIELKDPSWKMMLPLYIFAILIIVLGVYSEPLINYIYEVSRVI
ncbi:MAG: proton-conducting membrane transporter [Lachnospiraceae bacterium]|nr:proton-conducting membrane transporter [Lachnospiraceae bacterium]